MNIVDKNIRFTYIRDYEDDGRVLTIARRWGRNGNKLHYAYALCRPDTDRFEKMLGREIACGRLSKEPRKIRPNNDKLVIRAIMQDICERDTVPPILRKLANQWLSTEYYGTESEYPRDWV